MADHNTQKKVFTDEKIRKSGYRGKAENFDPNRIAKSGKSKHVGKAQAQRTEKLKELSSPKNQSGESILTEMFFGLDFGTTEIEPFQSFAANYRKIIDIAAEVNRVIHNYHVDQVIAREEMAYYATALLQCRLIEIAKRNRALTSPEEDFREGIMDYEFNVPEPLAVYLSSIGPYHDQGGKTTYLEIPTLPTTVVEGLGGYHANAINQDTHNLFEEVPSLGIAGDMLMVLASEEEEPTPNFHVAKPPRSEFTTSLVGKFDPIGPRKPEIRKRLEGYGITATSFDEYIPGTRFNLQYIRLISDIIGNQDTFINFKFVFRNLKEMGGESQIIHTRPSGATDTQKWNERKVRATSVAKSPVGEFGAALMFGFQLYKEDGPGDTRMEKVANWSCVTGVKDQPCPWVMPDDWYNNRNDRRNLPVFFQYSTVQYKFDVSRKQAA